MSKDLEEIMSKDSKAEKLKIDTTLGKLPQKENNSILFTYLTNSSKSKAIELNIIARKNNIESELAISSRSLKANMRYANNLKFSTIVIIGDPDEKLNYITYKELNTGDQKDINEKELIDLGFNVKAIQGDVRYPKEVNNIVEQTVSIYKKINILIILYLRSFLLK